VYIKQFQKGNLSILTLNKKISVVIILDGPTEFSTYKILKESGEISWISHTCLEDVQL
jgi:hypothetical protein